MYNFFKRVAWFLCMKKQIIALLMLFVSLPSFGLQSFWNALKKSLFPQKSEEQLFSEALNQTYRSKYAQFAQFLEKHPLWVFKIDPCMQAVYMNDVIEKKDHTSIVRFVNAGISPDIPDYYGCPLLTRAILNHSTETVKVLLQCGSDPEMCDKNRLCPLHYACVLKKKEMIKLLVSAGASLDKYTLDKLISAGSYNDIILYVWRLVNENPILAASKGLLYTNNLSNAIDFTVCYSRSVTGKITPLHALLKNKHIDMALIVFKRLIDDIEKDQNNKRAAIAALAILKHPMHDDRSKAMLGEALIFDSNGRTRDFFIQRLMQ